MHFPSLCFVTVRPYTRAVGQIETLTQAAVAVVNHEVGAEGPGREVVHAAGAVRHVPHHDGVGLREPAQKMLISAVTRQRLIAIANRYT